MNYPAFCLFKQHPCIILFLFILLTFNLQAQRPEYKISVALDTITHSIQGNIHIKYTNNSQQALDKLGIHLWADAHKSRETALVHQKLHLKDLELYRAPVTDLGGYSDIHFTSPTQDLSMSIESENIDIAWLQLSEQLHPGKSIEVETDFILDIPKSFSRLGRTNRSYQLTQWYPHIAVFEDGMWHTIPNLDQGEYFNDFADYLITINTPVNYMVAATGVLVSSATKDNNIERTYLAKNVIDFAWFASPDFIHEVRQVDVGKDAPVVLNIFYESYLNKLWSQATSYGEQALKFYSDWLGPYPYEQMTVVYTPYSNAGFMEYPMLSQISYTDDPEFLDRTIAHEIGHTWVYGILANNERLYPWLDEGLNSFVESEYMNAFYTSPKENYFPDIVYHHHSMPDYDALQHMLRSSRDLQPSMTHPERQQSSQYALSAYIQPVQGLELMRQQVGEEMLKEMFRNYFQENKFTHVSPEDLRSSFEKVCSCDLSWFFDGWLHQAHEIDYRFKKVDIQKNEIIVENKSSTVLPLLLSEYYNDELINKDWIPGFAGLKSFQLNEKTDRIELYEGMMGVNKLWWKNVYPRTIVPRISLFPKVGSYSRPSLALTPVIGYNLADGLMPGIAITSDLLPQPRFKFFLMPMYAIDSKKLRFYTEGRYITDVNRKPFDKLLLGFSASQFSYHLDTHYLFRDQFTRLSPFLSLRLKSSSPYSHTTSWVKYRYVHIRQNYGSPVDFESYAYENQERQYGIHELAFKMSSDIVLQPYTGTAALQAGKGFVRLNLHYNQHFRGKDKMRGLWVHGFAGWLPVNKKSDAYVILHFNGITSNDFRSKDYMYDEWLLGRNAEDGNLSRQIFMKDANLKTLANIGIGKDWMLGGGVSVSLPLKVLHGYIDGAFYESGLTRDMTFSYSGGLAIILLKDEFEIYIPILESKDIRESLVYDVRDRWFQRISFMANFKLANPLELIDRGQFQY